jgi:hypothetical protein
VKDCKNVVNNEANVMGTRSESRENGTELKTVRSLEEL